MLIVKGGGKVRRNFPVGRIGPFFFFAKYYSVSMMTQTHTPSPSALAHGRLRPFLLYCSTQSWSDWEMTQHATRQDTEEVALPAQSFL